MARIHFITHPEVVIDPSVPIGQWGLSPRGLARGRAMLAHPWVAGVASVFSSAERKALDLAALLAGHRGLAVAEHPALGENDRSATGYLPKTEFEATADAFFARPTDSVRGWERAVDAQARIVAALRAVEAAAPPGEVAVVAHGGVGALLLCHLKAVPISRAEDQPGEGGGNRFVFTRGQWRLLEGWQPIES
ncbi:histidine phosphatase family protein [Falsiroseomonas selenitidurans]|uniref:Histidine phosphatase family protein n=1 Tax=Falsiroseomonas selenitidurans TaxID=2716335 RepID=A0ABX1E6U5_9PROT|nr:histidine phosphatase family protein [Falsiroseomonas selenitidurans]NKC30655.1 histidine phosphatase family protein [Falsiroseomonas selenitidurans]